MPGVRAGRAGDRRAAPVAHRDRRPQRRPAGRRPRHRRATSTDAGANRPEPPTATRRWAARPRRPRDRRPMTPTGAGTRYQPIPVDRRGVTRPRPKVVPSAADRYSWRRSAAGAGEREGHVVLAIQVRPAGPAAHPARSAESRRAGTCSELRARRSWPVTTSRSWTASTCRWWCAAGSRSWPRPSTSPAPGSRAGSAQVLHRASARCRSTAPTPTPRRPLCETAERLLGQGKLLGMYPEGTRSPDGRLYKGKTGLARLALQTGVPVIPVAMIGTDVRQPARHLDAALRAGRRSASASRWTSPASRAWPVTASSSGPSSTR